MPLLEMLQVLSKTPVSQPQLRAVIAVTCGRWCAARGEDAEALRLLAHALELVPDLRPAMRLLYRIYLRRGDVRNAVRYLDQEIRATRHPREAAALYRERGKLVERHFGDRAAALQCYRAALKATPRDLAVLRSVEAVALLKGDVFALIGNLEAQLDVLHDPAAVAAVFRDLALLEARRGGDLQLAAEMLAAALEELPNHSSLARDLSLAAAASGDASNILLAAELEAECHPGGPGRALALARASAVLSAARERPAAVQLLQAAAHAQPANLSLWRELETASMATSRYDMAVEACLGQLKAIGDSDVPAQAELFYRIGRLAMLRLDRVTEGLAAMRKALRLYPEHIPALEDAGRYLIANEAWSQLLELLKLQFATAEEAGLSPEAQAQALLRAGQVMEEHLGEAEGARQLYEQAAAACPSYRPGLDRLEQTLHQLGRHDALRELYQEELSRTKDNAPRKIFLLSVLSQLHARDEDPSHAIKILIALLKEQPEHMPSLQLLARLLARAGRPKELRQITEQEVKLTENPVRKAKLLHRKAELALEIGERGAAYVDLDAALKAVPDDQPSLELLERMLREDGDHTQLLELLRRRLEHAEDRERRIALHLEIANLLASELGDREAALVELGRLLKTYPGQLPALHFSEQLASELSRPQLLVRLFAKHLETVKSAWTRALLLYRTALLQVRDLDDREGAIQSLRRGVDLAPQIGLLRNLLLDLCKFAPEHQDLFRVAAREALVWERGPGDRRAIALELAERTPSPESAVRYLQAAVTAAPADVVSQRHLVRAARLVARPRIGATAYGALAEQLSVQIKGDKRRDPAHDPAVLDMRFRAAQAAEAAGDLHAADKAFGALLELDPGNELARRARARIEERRRPQEADKSITALIGAAASDRAAPERAALLCRAAELYSKHGRHKEARATIDRAIAACPDYQPALYAKLRVLSHLDGRAELEAALATYEQLADKLLLTGHKVEALCRAGRLALHAPSSKLPKAAQAAWRLFEKALSLDPASRIAFHGLWQTCAVHGGKDAPALSTSLLRRVEALDHAGTLTGRALRAMARLGREGDGPECAVELLEHGQTIAAKNTRSQVGESVSGDPAVPMELAAALAELGRWSETAIQLRRALALETAPERKAAVQFFIAEALEKAGDYKQAIDYYIRASRGGYHPRHALRAADRLAAEHGEVDQRVETLHLLLTVGSEDERATSLRTLAALHRDVLRQPDDALRLMEDYLKLRPLDTESTTELAKLQAKAGRPERGAAALAFGLAAHRVVLRDRGDERRALVKSVEGCVRLFSALDRGDGEYVATAALEVLEPSSVLTGRGCDDLVADPWPLPELADRGTPTLSTDGLYGASAFALLREGVASLTELPGGPPVPLKIGARRSLPPNSKLASVVRTFATVLGVPSPPVYLRPKNKQNPIPKGKDTNVAAFLGDGPLLLVGRSVNANPHSPIARDALGRALVRLAVGGDFVTAGMTGPQLAGLLYGLAEGVGVGLELQTPHDETIAEQVIELLADSAASMDFGEAAEQFAREASEFDPERFQDTLRALEDRAGVLCSGDPRISLRRFAEARELPSARAARLISFVVSDEHLWLRRSLGYDPSEVLEIIDVEEML
ncbi:MAG: hypothetical protein KC468_12860 [Myxococcales bacterium]|nr:hypothetical protein [Myxococcales bacterium]